MHADGIGITGRKTFCWCDGQAPQSNGQPALTGVVTRRGGVIGATNDIASRYHSTDEATMTRWCPCDGQNLSNQTESPANCTLASTADLHTPQRLLVSP